MYLLDTPWKLTNEVRRILFSPFCRIYFAYHGIAWQSGWRIFGLPLIQRHRQSKIAIGTSFQMRNWFSSNPLGVNHRSVLATWSASAQINIGHHVGMTGTSIVAETQVSIGNHVRVGANSTIADTDFHPLSFRQRLLDPRAGDTQAIHIGDNVFIGMNVIILKGSSIGNNSVIGAGSIVTGDIPAGVIAAGNPARVMREIVDG